MIEKKPFRSYTLDEDKPEKDREIISLSLSLEERKELNILKSIIHQPKDSTAIKQLMKVGSKVILDKKTTEIISIIFGNQRRNKRTGIIDFEQ